MIQWIYLMVHDTVCIAAGTYLIINDHPWWAILPFVLAATTTLKSTTK
jgi:hypothetical protein